MDHSARISRLEAQADELAERMQRLESAAGSGLVVTRAPSVGPRKGRSAAPTAPAPRPQVPADRPADPPAGGLRPAGRAATRQAPPAAPPEAATPQPTSSRAGSLEELLGGRVLAWAGGAAVLVGLVLLAAVAVSSGWVGEGMRTAAAGLLSTMLVGAGAWLHERRGRTDAARAAAASGVGGLFVTAVLATRVYEVAPIAVGIALAVAAGAVGVGLALRWEARDLAALGLLGALAAPLLTGAHGPATTLLVWVMAAAATALLLARRWDWLGLGAYAVTTPQWVAWLVDVSAPGDQAVAAMTAIVGFGALALAAAVGFELRTRATDLRPAGALLLVVNAAVVAACGWSVVEGAGGEALADGWLAALAGAHLLAAVAARRSDRVSTELVTLLAVVGVVLADVAVAAVVHGPAQPLIWSAGAVLAGVVARRLRAATPVPRLTADLGIGAHIALAIGHALVEDAPLHAVAGGALAPAQTGALLAVAAGCLTAGRLAGWQEGARRLILDGVGLSTVAYLLAHQLDGAALTAAWAAEAVVLAAIAQRTGELSAAWGAIVGVSLAVMHAVVFEAPPTALVHGLPAPIQALVALGAVTAALVALARSRRVAETLAAATGVAPGSVAATFAGAGALSALYLTSTELVSAVVGPDRGAIPIGVGPHDQAQMLLSALWAIVGTAGLVAGLRRNERPLRLAALGLLLIAAGKVFVFDLAALSSGWRVGSFLVLGLLLLAGAFAWQRLRPRPAPDLREMPAALR